MAALSVPLLSSAMKVSLSVNVARGMIGNSISPCSTFVLAFRKAFRLFLEYQASFGEFFCKDLCTTNSMRKALTEIMVTEAVLFCLDFSVSQATSTNLYRFHDDLWFWGPEEIVVTAWNAIKQFTDMMGLALNTEKTEITGKAESSIIVEELPKGPIRWGFLKLDTCGKWTIDDKEVDDHIVELRRQLAACKRVLA